ncbi:MAG: hypothetical protein VYA79_05490 [Candidatus Thermoplasmatota archaeon]|nr:hypothetical protein [Candidatus Thermoplasmatota archaeon]
MARGIMKYAKILSALSFFLLLMGTVAWSSASDESEKYLDPSQFNEAVIGPGESIVVNISSTSFLGQREYLAMRIVEDSDPLPEVRLTLGSDECRSDDPSIIHIDRQLNPDSPKFRVVRVFLPNETGDYTLYNDAESGDLWLVDDFRSQTRIFQENPISIVVMIGGCCIGVPVGLVALCLAIIGWRQNGAQESILVQPQDQLMTTSDLYREYQKSQAEIESRQTAPDPFLEVTRADYSDIVDDVNPPADENWENWDNG